MVWREVVENVWFKEQAGWLTESQHNIITVLPDTIPLAIALAT